MHLNLKQIINDLLLQESVREVDTFINQQRDEIEKETLRTFFHKFKTHSGSNPDQTLAQIKVPFFKWLFNVSVGQNQNITDQELNHFFDISILYFNNKNKFNFNFQLNPIRPTWDAFEADVLEKTEEQRERQAEESTLVQLISKDINTRWFDSNNSKVNKPEIIKKFKTWNENSKLSKQDKQENILVIEPRTTLSSKFWGNPRCFGVDVGYGVKWCTSATQSGNMFHHYTRHSGSRLIYIINLSQPDQNPWQKIAVLIGRNGIQIFDATDKSYSVEYIQSHVKPEIFQIINELINKYSDAENDQYSPSQFENLSQEEKRILFLTSLRDPSSEDKKYIAQHFKEFFSSPTTSEHNRKQIIKNLIGSSDYDDTLIDLIDNYLRKNLESNYIEYSKIVEYLNSPEKQSKAVMKFYENSTFFSINEKSQAENHWELFEKYLNNEQKRKIAIKFVLNHDIYFQANWYHLSEYLTPSEKSEAAYKIFINQTELDEYKWKYLSTFLSADQKNKLAKHFIIENISENNHIIIITYEQLFSYLSQDEKSEAAEKFMVRGNINLITDEHINIFYRYLNLEAREKISENFIEKPYRVSDIVWTSLTLPLEDSERDEIIEKKIRDSGFLIQVWKKFSIFLSKQKQKELAAEAFLTLNYDDDANDYDDAKYVYYSDNYFSQEEKIELGKEFLKKRFFDSDIFGEISPYLTNQEKSKTANKILLNEFDYVKWEKLSPYLTFQEKKQAIKNFTESATYIGEYYWEEIISKYLSEQEKKDLAKQFILSKDYFNIEDWDILSPYLTNQEKVTFARKIFFNPEKDRIGYEWEKLSPYLNDQEKRQIAKKYIVDKNYKINLGTFEILSEYLTEEEREKAKEELSYYYGERERNQLRDGENEVPARRARVIRRGRMENDGIEESYKRKIKLLKLAVNNLL